MNTSKIFVFILSILSCTSYAGSNINLVEKWKTDRVFKQPESVTYDILRKSIYVSNVNGGPLSKDGNGFISLLSIQGEIENLEWIDGLHAPKGMAIRGAQLFIADIDQLIVVDVEKAEIIKRFDADKSSLLNDVAISSDGTVFVTDTINSRIYSLHKGEFTIWMDNKRLESPNGIYVDNQNIYIGSWGVADENWKTEVPGHVLQINMSDKSITDYGASDPIGNLDGIAKISNDSLIVSDWMNGNIIEVRNDGSTNNLLSLNPGSADFLFSRSLNLLVVPSMNDGVLLGYSIFK